MLNCLLSLFGCVIATLETHQRPPAIDRPTLGRGPAMSGVAIFGLAALSAWLAINIAIAVVAVTWAGASARAVEIGLALGLAFIVGFGIAELVAMALRWWRR